jgi:hypothetical protein
MNQVTVIVMSERQIKQLPSLGSILFCLDF